MMQRIKPRIVALCIVLLAFFLNNCAEIQSGSINAILRSVEDSMGTSLDERTVAAGLKEALHVGTTRAVKLTSQVDGYLANALIRIMLPEQLEPMADTLRKIGLGRHVDTLEVAMNRAAERAAGEARHIFWEAISSMTISDAFTILKGNDTAATDYLHSHTANRLRDRFRPIITTKMQEVGLYRIYEDISGRYNALPFVSKPAIDLDEYVTDKALGGLFTMLGQEEKRIREDPLARTTELLQRVFRS